MRCIPGDERNIKITYPHDLDVAAKLAAAMPDPAGTGMRTVAAVLAAPADGPSRPASAVAPLAGRPLIEHSVAAFEASPWSARSW